MGSSFTKNNEMKYDKLEVFDTGWCDWQTPIHGRGKNNYRLACCDCGLVHEMQFRIFLGTNKKMNVMFRVKRNNRATAAKRRGKNILTNGKA